MQPQTGDHSGFRINKASRCVCSLEAAPGENHTKPPPVHHLQFLWHQHASCQPSAMQSNITTICCEIHLAFGFIESRIEVKENPKLGQG